MAQNARGALRQLEELLGRAVTSDEMSEAVRLGLEMLISTLEKRRYAATDRPRRTRGNTRGRRIPAAVKREVAARDGRRCTYVSADGRRCAARGRLEYDHIVPVARGGASTAANLRLRCRAHNQYEAEQVFGVGFMHEKRQRAGRVARAGQAAGIEHQQTTTPRVAATKDRTAAIMRREARLRTQPGPRPRDEAIIPCLRQLGFRSGEVKRAAEHCATLREAPLEQRVREALRLLAPHGGVRRVEPLRSPQP